MHIYNDFKGQQQRNVHAGKRTMTTEEGTSDSNDMSSQTKEPGALFNGGRTPLNPSNRNAANSSDYCRNGGLSVSTSTTQGFVGKSVGGSCASTKFYTPKSKAHAGGNITRSMQHRLSECKVDVSGDDTQINRTKRVSLVGQRKNGSTLPQSVRASGNRRRSTRSFIAERRSKLATKEEEESYVFQEEMSGYETPQDIPALSLLDDGEPADLPKAVTPVVTEVTKERHDEGERRQSQKSLVGTDIVCVPQAHDAYVSIGQLSVNDETSSTALGINSLARNSKLNHRDDDTSLPILYLGSFQQSLLLDFGDDRSNIVGSSRSLQFQLRAPKSLHESSSASSSSSVYVDDDCCIVKVEKVPVKKGITLKIFDPCEDEKEEESADPATFSIDNGKSRKLTLIWKPVEAGGIRETIYLKLQRGRIVIIAEGKAREAKKSKTAKARKKVPNDEPTQMQGPPVAIRKHLSTCLKTNKNYSLGFDSCLEKDNLPETVVKSTASPTKSITSRSPRELTRTRSLPLNSVKTTFSPTKTRSPPRKSNSFAGPYKTRSMNNDAWVDKQCNTYQEWLNFLFQNRDGMHETDSMLGVDTVQPSERQTIRSLLIQRQGAHTRQMAISFYRGPEMLAIRNTIELDVDNKRLCFRTDPYALANLSLHSRLVSLLLSYSAPWLRLGLETIFGETITANLSSESSATETETRSLSGMRRGAPKKTTIKALLKRFIIERILSDPDIKMKYTRGKCMMPSGKFEVLYKEEMGRYVLKRIIPLVVFLDHAKTEDIIHPSPCLFNKNAIVKSTKDFLAILCKDYIHGIGCLSKHLGLIGISVSYTQSHVDELDFSISNMAVDLRDGTRLAKLAEILSGDSKSSTLKKLRLPAVSRLQKVHNLRVALSAFSNLSIPNIEFVQPEHIVDGHRPQVLQFLWSIISHFNLSNLLDMAKLKEETDAVHHSNKRKSKEYEIFRHTAQNGDDEHRDDLCNLLLQWCRAVCWSYDVEVTDFSKSFSDGKVICCLVHFYHPSILRRDEILPTASDIFHCGVNADSIKKDPRLQQQYRQALENERQNSELANKRMKEIGGIPHVLPITDSTTIPDERSTIISIAYLCSRLLESSAEILSTITVQRAFRNYQNKKLHELKRRYQAASRIQAVYRGHMLNGYTLYMRNQIIMIQKVWRGFLCRRNYRNSTRCAVLIQKIVRRKLASSVVATRKDAITKMQCAARRYLAVCKLSEMDYKYRLNLAAITCQACTRRNIAMKNFHKEITRAQAAAIIVQKAYRHRLHSLRKNEGVAKIQALYRGCQTRTLRNSMAESAVVIQTVWRSFFAQLIYTRVVSNIICAQSAVRGQIARRAREERTIAIVMIQRICHKYLALCSYRKNISEYESSRKIQAIYRSYRMSSYFANMKESASIIQAAYKGILVRKQLKLVSSSAVLIQKKWRGFSAYLQYKFDLSDIVFVQSLVRKKLAAGKINERKTAITQIQSAYRKWIAVRIARDLAEILNQDTIAHQAAIVCQALVRRWIVCMSMKKQKLHSSAALLIQKNWRCHTLQSSHKLTVQAIKVIQNFIRYWIARRTFKVVLIQKNHNCALRIQRMFRGASARSLVRKYTSARTIQKYWRGYVLNVNYMISIFAVIILQKFVRQKTTRCNYQTIVKSIKVLQSHTRRLLARNFFKEQKDSASSIQRWWKTIILSQNHKFAATKIQRFLRGQILRENLRVQHSSACNIQKCWRVYHSNTNFMLIMLSIIKIQSLWRLALAKRRVVPETALLLSRALQGSIYPRLQRRSHLWMVIEFQTRWRRRSARMKFLRAKKGFISLQSLFRGQCIRRLSSRRMFTLAKRIARANRVARADPQMTLGAKTSNALRILQRSQRLTEIMDAVRTLETSTGLSPNCCIAFTNAEAHNILYHLIRSCNRSLPHVELLQFILMTLSNISNHAILISRIATSESIDILIDLIQMFRDKDSIFCLASTLLELLALSEDMFTVQCQKRENLKRIQGVHNLCLRKLSLKNNSTAIKSASQMRQSNSGSIRSNSTGSKKLNRMRHSETVSKEMSSGIRALQHLLHQTSKHQNMDRHDP